MNDVFIFFFLTNRAKQASAVRSGEARLRQRRALLYSLLGNFWVQVMTIFSISQN